VCAAAIVAVAAWLSFASFALTADGQGRAALVPIDLWHLALALIVGVFAGAAAWRPGRARGVLVAISPLALVLLPWIPFRVPPAFLIWTGPMLGLVWMGCALGVMAVTRRDILTVNATPPSRQCLRAGVVSFVLFALAAWFASPSLPGGDEPHYLVITQSLLYDHDLKIENNHRRGDYHAYFAGDLNPDYVQRGRNGEIYSIHAPGVPALVLPAFAVAGYHGVVVFLLLAAAAASALAWWLAWRLTDSAAAAWFGWAAVALSAPFLVETFTVYPDGPGAGVVLTGVWALMRADWERRTRSERWMPWFLHGAALALLPWMHTRFAVIAATLGGLVLLRLSRTPNPLAKAIAFLAVPAASALSWLFFFVIVYGMPDPSAPYGRQAQNSFSYLSNGIGGLFFDQGFGLLVTAPVLTVALVGFTRLRRFALEYAVVGIPYLLAVATFAMWWAGWSGPARFLVPLVLPLALPAAQAWAETSRRPGMRAVMIAALAVSVWLSAAMVGVGGGRLAYHSRNESGATAAPWAEWASRAVDLPSALPGFVPLPIGTAVEARHAAARAGMFAAIPWIAGAALIVLVMRRSRLREGHLAAAVTWSAAAMIMASATIVWQATGATPLRAAPSQLAALRAISSRPIVVDVRGKKVVSREDYVASMSIAADVSSSHARPGPRGGRPLAILPGVPAGDYRLSIDAQRSDGWLMAGIAQDQFAILTQPLAVLDSGVTLRLPVDVPSIVVRVDEQARDAITRVVLHPLRLLDPRDRLTSEPARRAVRYDGSIVYFLDDRAFAEPSGFWVGGARSTSIVVAPDAISSVVRLTVRNAPVSNELDVVSGSWHQTVALAPGETRDLQVPMDASRGAALVQLRSSSGFRPSEQGSRDSRFLGAWVRLK